jgi:hypothetical protein
MVVSDTLTGSLVIDVGVMLLHHCLDAPAVGQ